MKKNYKIEYVWLDGYTPEPNLRSKTKILSLENEPELSDLPDWSFDGSSTQQAEGHFSDCLLKPVKMVIDPQRINGYVALCEVLDSKGNPHPSNTRNNIKNIETNWYGFEQEYVLTQNGRPVGFPENGFPKPQGEYYCGVGSTAVVARELIEEHLNVCLEAGLSITGINAEVLLGQWEFQVFGKGSHDACDQLWIARYFLHRIAEKYDVKIELFPKPLSGDWNGSGLHTNFSTEEMRTTGGEALFNKIFKVFEKNRANHIANYGSSNHLRLTGKHETQSIDKFSFGVSDRGASIRIPAGTAQNWVGYLEDRRPASNGDPYRIVAAIQSSLAEL